METYIKIDEENAEIITPQQDKVETVNINNLINLKEGCQIEIQREQKVLVDYVARKESEIADLELKITKLKKIGVEPKLRIDVTETPK